MRWRACDLILRLHEEFGISVSDDTVYRALRDLSFSHERQAQGLQADRCDRAFNFPASFGIRSTLRPPPIGVWCQDEMRVGQKNKLTYRWARKGSRPRATHDQRTQSTYLFGAVCPERGAGAALVLPACNSEAMQLHLDEIATKVTPGCTRSYSSIKPAGMAARFSRSRVIFRSCRCRPAHPNSTARKTSGNSETELALQPGLQIL